MTEENIGQRIKELRGQKGLSQEELARRIAMPRTAVTKIESGSQEVRFRELAKFAEALGISLGTLLEERRPVRESVEDAFLRVSDSAQGYGHIRPELETMLHVILLSAAGDPLLDGRRITETVLEADRMHLAAYGKSISGMPKGSSSEMEHAISTTLANMVKEHVLHMVVDRESGARRYLPLMKPDLQELSAAAYVLIEKAVAMTG
ncbi:helix-turn-helix domain-containing protein [Pelodictyon luteolum]|uniref:Transcriptional regulator, XRE family n=1 Tax=Chlorobium luteolum (strain DSM 273 / BCRC 81028 / 2530) TaxID=319225 RepID=Q3B5G8_CHLL3|nr:helix-turn-helix transcriptional regulator [Pelodictyon luteolum]ABB23413.1 transcriptional regulator, XRE family [Pelodictyon luteolum DSM 273]